MSMLIQAKLTKRRWLDWAKKSLTQRDEVEASNAHSVIEKLKELKSEHRKSLSYEVSTVSIADASTAIRAGISRLGLDFGLCVVGDPLDPAVLQLAETDLDAVLKMGAESDKTIAFAPRAMDGLFVVDMPAHNGSGLLVSGCGSMEELITEIQVTLPGGSLFRAN